LPQPIARVIRTLKHNGPRAAASTIRYGLRWRYRRLRLRAAAALSGASSTQSVRSSPSTAAVPRESLRAAESQLRALALAEPNALPEVYGRPDLTIAVIVPTFADAEFLPSALASVEQQTYQAWRCYVVDDASPDDVRAAMKPFLADDRFVLLRHGANAGLAAARNTGLRHAQEMAVQFLDADDMLMPWALECRAAELRRKWNDPVVAGSYGEVVQCPEETTLEDIRAWDNTGRRLTLDWLASAGENPFTIHAPLLRTSVAKGVGGFDERMVNGAEDWDFWHRILRHGYTFVSSNRVVGAYRQRRASMIREHSDSHLKRADDLLDLGRVWVQVDPDIAVTNAAMPLADAQVGLHRLLRTALWSGMLAAQDGHLVRDEGDQVLKLLEPEHTPTTRTTEVIRSARRGMVRGLGLSPISAKALERDTVAVLDTAAQHVADSLMAQVERSCGRPGEIGPSDAVPIHRRTEVDIAVIGETVADVDVLKRTADRLAAAGLRTVAVDIDYIKGTEGFRPHWNSAEIPLVPYNDIALGNVSMRSILARRPASPVTQDLMHSLLDNGGACYFLRESERPLTVDETVVASGIPDVTAEGLIRILKDEDQESRSVITTTAFSPHLPAEESGIDPDNRRKLRDLRGLHDGETCVIIGNGPSLNQIDLSLLRGTATFGVNSIFLADDRLPEPLTYYVVEDTAVFEDNVDRIKEYHAGTKLFPSIYASRFSSEDRGDNTIFFRMNQGFYGRSGPDGRATRTLGFPRFSMDASERLFCGQSVTIINLQLAHWMGFKRVVLIGMDFSYTIPDDAERTGDRILSKSDDPNHFHPDYFGTGKTWKNPKLDRVLISYHLVDEIYRATGREIINATVGGALNLFPRMPLEQALAH
jgi:GT2 family glycosyltransferase